MPNPTPKEHDPAHADGKMREDDVNVPRAPDDKVLDATTRMAKEGQKKLESDPRERGSAGTQTDTPRE